MDTGLKILRIFLNQFLADKDIPWQFQISSLFEQKIEEKHFMCTNKAIELLDNFYEGHKKIMALLPWEKDQIKRSVIKRSNVSVIVH